MQVIALPPVGDFVDKYNHLRMLKCPYLSKYLGFNLDPLLVVCQAGLPMDQFTREHLVQLLYSLNFLDENMISIDLTSESIRQTDGRLLIYHFGKLHLTGIYHQKYIPPEAKITPAVVDL
jgi:hypothetical protein